MDENEKIIYLLKINPDPEGELNIEGERFKVHEAVRRDWVDFYRENRLTPSLLNSFVNGYKQAKREGREPKKNFEYVLTLDEKVDDR